MRTAAHSTSQVEADSLDVWRWIGRLTFGLMLAVVICRSTMLEYLRDPFPVTPGADPAARGPGPSTTLLLDLLCATPALLVLLRASLDSTFTLRKSRANVVMLLLAVWICCSALWADDRFSASVSAAN